MNKIKTTQKKVKDLKASEYNPRQITKEQFNQLKDSVNKFGCVEPLIVNKNPKRKNVVIGGHQRLQVAKSLGYDVLPCVELDLTLEQEKELNIRLNKNGGTFDFDLLANNFELELLKDIGFKDIELGFNIDKIDDNYTRKIKLPTYEPCNEKPELNELVDNVKTKKLISKIKKLKVSKEVKEFLTYSAYRHNRFNYGKIADFYAHSDKEVQDVMEDLALVIIDLNKAIEKGFVELTHNISNLFNDEYSQ
tara:strand:- start:216 stop:962 length:747 start_codon:yes stop_codon:yes gene_type:complete